MSFVARAAPSWSPADKLSFLASSQSGRASHVLFWTTDANLRGLVPVTSSTAPEPAGLLLLASGLAGIAVLLRRALQS